MPLRIKCNSCRQVLVLHDVYRGGFCRCRFCHTHQRVTYTGKYAPRPAARPDVPGLRVGGAGPAGRAPHWASGASIDIDDAGVMRQAPRWSFASTAVSLVVVGVCALAWQWSAIDGGRGSVGRSSLAVVDPFEVQRNSARVDVSRLLSRSDVGDYFGVPVDDASTGILIDGSEELLTYSNAVARLTYAAQVHADASGADLNIMTATGGARNARSVGAPGSEDDLTVLLTSVRRRAGKAPFQLSSATLSEAVATTRDWQPERLFVVLARPLPTTEADALTAAVRASGVETHIISLGAARDMDMATVAAAGNGWTIPVSDAALSRLVARCPVELPILSK